MCKMEVTKTEVFSCPRCDGSGVIEGNIYRSDPPPDYSCEHCGGNGEYVHKKSKCKFGSGQIEVTYTMISDRNCLLCKGNKVDPNKTGRISCSVCYGTGKYLYNTKVKPHSGGGCFITSACVDYFQLGDDCYELQTLRHFRDNVLLTTAEGRQLVDRYYHIAPAIVKQIRANNEHQTFCLILDGVKNCVSYIEAGKVEDAINGYKEMVFNLELQFESSDGTCL